MKGLEKKVDIGGVTVTVRELTVADVRNWFKRLEEAQVDVVGDLLFEDIALGDLAMLTDASEQDLERMPPSQIRLLIAACREVNVDFFSLRARLSGMGAKLMDSANAA